MREIIIKQFNQLTLDELYMLLKARVDVFVVEQNCPYPELDDIDQEAYHVFIKEDNQIVAYLRAFNKDESKNVSQIGRVLTLIRGQNFGFEVMNAGIDVCKKILMGKQIYIEAQCYAIPFYEKFGFKTISEMFLEDNIPHVQMLLELGDE